VWVIAAATGRQGRAVTEALLQHGWPVRALVRNPDSSTATELAAAGAEIAVCDFEDVDTVATALNGARGLFLYHPIFISLEVTPGLGPNSELTHGRAVIDAALSAGIEHLVYSSALGVDRDPGPLFAPKQQLEQELLASDIPSTMIRPVGFMENYAGPDRGLQPDGTIVTAAPPHVIEQLVAVRDIGAFAQLAFDEPGRYAGTAFELAGDELTTPQIAAAISAALDQPVRYKQIAIDEIRRVDPDHANALQRLYSQPPTPVDISTLREQHPGLLDFHAWLSTGGAAQIRVYLHAVNDNRAAIHIEPHSSIEN
jgi:uncharacterized protein YbjT (DUF2867 family)